MGINTIMLRLRDFFDKHSEQLRKHFVSKRKETVHDDCPLDKDGCGTLEKLVLIRFGTSLNLSL